MTKKEHYNHSRLFWLIISPAYSDADKVKIANELIMEFGSKNQNKIIKEFHLLRDGLMNDLQLTYDDTTKTIRNNIGEEFMEYQKFNDYVEYLFIEGKIKL